VRHNLGHAYLDVTRLFYGKSCGKSRDALTQAVEAETSAAHLLKKEAA
jgi:hypothetical protein